MPYTELRVVTISGVLFVPSFSVCTRKAALTYLNILFFLFSFLGLG